MKINAIYKISDSPTIYASTGAGNWSELPVHQEQAFMLCHPMWQFSWSSLRLYQKLRRLLKAKNIHLVLLHNSSAEYRFGKRFGFDSTLLNQNIHTCEHNFIVDPQAKKYDAIYIAAAKPYKRIQLAADVNRLYVVTYFWPDVRDENGDWDLHSFEPRIKHADFNRRRIDASQISQILNSSHCGLALSKKEGAMWASMEYLLTGLPIVTTPSVGGRDFFFDPAYVKTVPATSSHIREAVEDFASQNLDPHWIREETLQKIEPYRKSYFEYCRSLSSHQTAWEDYELFRERVWGGKGIHKLRIL